MTGRTFGRLVLAIGGFIMFLDWWFSGRRR